MDRLARQGARFDDATIPGTWSWPSHASLFTGLFPWEHGAHFAAGAADGYAADSDPYKITALRADVPTLAERFSAAGYRTAVVTANKWLDKGFGLERGFGHVERHGRDARVVGAARQVIRDLDPRPLFLVVNLFGVHAPYEIQPAPWLSERAADLDPATAPGWLAPFIFDREDGVRTVNFFRAPEGQDIGIFDVLRGKIHIPAEGQALLREVYDGEVWEADRALGALMGIWDGRGRGPGIVALTSDHGEFLGERGLMDHGRRVYPEVTHVPLLIRAPSQIPAGTVVQAAVHAHHVHDSLLELAGLAHGDNSLLPATKGQPPTAPIQAAAWADDLWAKQVGGPFTQGQRLFRRDPLAVLIATDGRLECFDTAADPGMRSDILQTHPEACRALAAEADTAFPEHAGGGFVQIDDQAADELRALGYLE
jgi:arylsulfatase A-like enzyme